MAHSASRLSLMSSKQSMDSSILHQAHIILSFPAETGMQIAKQILEQGDTFLALMAYHATPVPATEKTPSELIMGRQIQTTMQTMANILEPKLPTTAAVKKADAKVKWGYKESFDRRNGTRELPQLQPGLWVGAKPDTEKQRTTEA